jgi:hypothetical protein
MVFDINIVLKEMSEAIVGSLGDDANKKAGTQTSVLFAAHRDTLKQISDLALAGDLTLEELRTEVRDELLLFESEMLASHLAGKATIQKAANAANDILIDALTELLP